MQKYVLFSKKLKRWRYLLVYMYENASWLKHKRNEHAYQTTGGFSGIQTGAALSGGRILDDGGPTEAVMFTVHRAARLPQLCRTPGTLRIQYQGAFARAERIEPERCSGNGEGFQLTRWGGGAAWALVWCRLFIAGWFSGALWFLDRMFPKQFNLNNKL
jgi:hypothetical protein